MKVFTFLQIFIGLISVCHGLDSLPYVTFMGKGSKDGDVMSVRGHNTNCNSPWTSIRPNWDRPIKNQTIKLDNSTKYRLGMELPPCDLEWKLHRSNNENSAVEELHGGNRKTSFGLNKYTFLLADWGNDCIDVKTYEAVRIRFIGVIKQNNGHSMSVCGKFDDRHSGWLGWSCQWGKSAIITANKVVIDLILPAPDKNFLWKWVWISVDGKQKPYEFHANSELRRTNLKEFRCQPDEILQIKSAINVIKVEKSCVSRTTPSPPPTTSTPTTIPTTTPSTTATTTSLSTTRTTSATQPTTTPTNTPNTPTATPTTTPKTSTTPRTSTATPTTTAATTPTTTPTKPATTGPTMATIMWSRDVNTSEVTPNTNEDGKADQLVSNKGLSEKMIIIISACSGLVFIIIIVIVIVVRVKRTPRKARHNQNKVDSIMQMSFTNPRTSEPFEDIAADTMNSIYIPGSTPGSPQVQRDSGVYDGLYSLAQPLPGDFNLYDEPRSIRDSRPPPPSDPPPTEPNMQRTNPLYDSEYSVPGAAEPTQRDGYKMFPNGEIYSKVIINPMFDEAAE